MAHGLVVKGCARPAFGGTSRRRSIMKNHQLSWWVTFLQDSTLQSSTSRGACGQRQTLSAFRSPRAARRDSRAERRAEEEFVRAAFNSARNPDFSVCCGRRAGGRGKRHKVRRRTIPVRRPLFRGIYHLIIPLIPESSFLRKVLFADRTYAFSTCFFSFLLVETP